MHGLVEIRIKIFFQGVDMIDNEKETAVLMKAMEENFPIPVLPTRELQRLIRKNKILLPKGHSLQIDKVHYLGDEGGICCRLALPEGSEEALITSVTHLRIHPGHCLAKEIAKYQKRRVKKLRKLHS
ncbi:MAG: hypothetical protein D3922_12950 [Candidatus Electrothrix sp. AR1]|nr:hypothetical protein [Candidatus Electrothrix sp. AR1]